MSKKNDNANGEQPLEITESQSVKDTAAKAFSPEQTISNAERAADDMCAEEQAMNITDLQERLDAASAEAEKNRDLYVRAVADLENYRRKAQREKQELSKFALQPLIEELLPSLDHLDMAVDAAKTSGDSKNLVMGVEMVASQMKKILANFGVEEIPADGKEFDPNFHECVSHEPDAKISENKVIRVTRRGYMYNGRMMRPATVIVSSGKPKD